MAPKRHIGRSSGQAERTWRASALVPPRPETVNGMRRPAFCWLKSPIIT